MRVLQTTILAFAVFLVPALASAYPATSKNRGDCYTDKESAEWLTVERITVNGCANPIAKPTKYVSGIDIFVPGTSYATVDCSKVRKSVKDRAPVNEGQKDLISASNASLKDPGNADKALCVFNIIYQWAKIDGLTLMTSGSLALQVQHNRNWVIGGFAAAWIKNHAVRDLGKAQPDKETKILDWFRVHAEQTYDHVKSYNEVNNHLYWKGYALMALGTALQAKKYVELARTCFNKGIDAITDAGDADDKGYFPAELKRANLSQHYHRFALTPMLGMVALSKSIDCNFLDSDSSENRIAFSLRKGIEASQDLNIFKKKVGVAQTFEGDVVETFEGLIPLLGDDAQARAMLKKVEEYLAARGKHIIPRDPQSPGQLGGDVSYYPPPGSYLITNSALKSFCGN